MRIKVRDKVYDSDNDDLPMMVEFSEEELEQVKNMIGKKYCIYPSKDHWIKNDYEKIKQWMEVW